MSWEEIILYYLLVCVIENSIGFHFDIFSCVHNVFWGRSSAFSFCVTGTVDMAHCTSFLHPHPSSSLWGPCRESLLGQFSSLRYSTYGDAISIFLCLVSGAWLSMLRRQPHAHTQSSALPKIQDHRDLPSDERIRKVYTVWDTIAWWEETKLLSLRQQTPLLDVTLSEKPGPC